VARNVSVARQLLSENDVDRVISNGAGVALPFVTLARLHGAEAHYIECTARCYGPSLTGRILERVPGVQTHTQHRSWERRGWHYAGSVFDGYEPDDAAATSRTPLRVVVTVGTMRFGFARLVERLRAILPDDAEVFWQIGPTPAPGLLDTHDSVPGSELARQFRRADVVVSHAGCGSALDALDAGKCAILVPRLKRFGEHVDDHQVEIARTLDERGLAIARQAHELTLDDLVAAASRAVRPAPWPDDIDLG
jgi:UDP-N-acetylglucosamine transferase subunit ALG13